MAKITPAVQVHSVPTVVMVLGRTRFATSQSATGAMTFRYPLTMAFQMAFIRATVTGPGVGDGDQRSAIGLRYGRRAPAPLVRVGASLRKLELPQRQR